jgi:hypothetical protein
MSINYQGLEGKTTGKIGNCTFYMMNEQNVVRQLPDVDYNQKTSLQQSNRKNIAILVSFFQQLKPVLYNTLNNRPENRAVYHHFLALNLSVSVIYGIFYPELFVFSGTGLDYTSFYIARNEEEGNQFIVTWDPVVSGNQSDTDFVQAILFSKKKQCFDFDLTQHERSSGSCTLIFEEKFKTDECYVYLCFVRQDMAISSNSYHQLFNAVT